MALMNRFILVNPKNEIDQSSSIPKQMTLLSHFFSDLKIKSSTVPKLFFNELL